MESDTIIDIDSLPHSKECSKDASVSENKKDNLSPHVGDMYCSKRNKYYIIILVGWLEDEHCFLYKSPNQYIEFTKTVENLNQYYTKIDHHFLFQEILETTEVEELTLHMGLLTVPYIYPQTYNDDDDETKKLERRINLHRRCVEYIDKKFYDPKRKLQEHDMLLKKDTTS